MNFGEIKEYIKSRFPQDSNEGFPGIQCVPTKNRPEILSEILSTIGESYQLKQLLREIIDHDDPDSGYTRSECHRLGFDKISIMISPEFQLRIHVWWPKAIIRQEGIHNHKFNFASRILKGKLNNTSYQKCDQNDDGAIARHEYLACPNNIKTSDRFQYMGLGYLRKQTQTELRQSSIYSMMHEEFHSTTPFSNDEIVATLFIRTADLKQQDTIFEERCFDFSSDIGDVQNIPFTKADYLARLEKIMTLL